MWVLDFRPTSHCRSRVFYAGTANNAITALAMVLVYASMWALLAAEETPEQIIEKIYGADLAKVKASPDTKDDAALANKLAQDAGSMGQNKLVQTALLRRALGLAVEDQEGTASAEQIASTLITLKACTEQQAWQDLVEKAQAALRRRNLGQEDKMLTAYYGWQYQLARVHFGAGDHNAADKQLGAIVRDAQAMKMKYLADQAMQLQARVKFEVPFRTAAKSAKVKAPGEDAKQNLQAGETILAQTGDWNEAAPYLIKSQEARWQLILRLHQQRKAGNRPPTDEFLPSLPASPLGPAQEPAWNLSSPNGSAGAASTGLNPPMPGGTSAPLPSSPVTSSSPADVYVPPDPGEPSAPGGPGAPAGPGGPNDPPGSNNPARNQPPPPPPPHIPTKEERAYMPLPPGSPGSPNSPTGPMRQSPREPMNAPPDSQQPPLPAGLKTSEILAAVSYLVELAAPAKRPSPIGRVALLREAAGLTAQAQAADQEGLTVSQKLELPSRVRTQQEAVAAAERALVDAFDRSIRLPWIQLQAKDLQQDWSSNDNYQQWKTLEKGVLSGNGSFYERRLRSKNANLADFVFEGEIYREDPDARVIFFLREHNGYPYYFVEVTEMRAYLVFCKAFLTESQTIARDDCDVPRRAWVKVRIVFEGDRYRVWIGGRQTADISAPGELSAGSLGITTVAGVAWFRNLRIRELK